MASGKCHNPRLAKSQITLNKVNILNWQEPHQFSPNCLRLVLRQTNKRWHRENVTTPGSQNLACLVRLYSGGLWTIAEAKLVSSLCRNRRCPFPLLFYSQVKVWLKINFATTMHFVLIVFNAFLLWCMCAASCRPSSVWYGCVDVGVKKNIRGSLCYHPIKWWGPTHDKILCNCRQTANWGPCSEISKRPLFWALSRTFFCKSTPYFVLNKDNFALQNTPIFITSRTLFKKYPYLCKNKDIIPKGNIIEMLYCIVISSFYNSYANDLYLIEVPMPLSLKCLCMYIPLAPWAPRNEWLEQA